MIWSKLMLAACLLALASPGWAAAPTVDNSISASSEAAATSLETVSWAIAGSTRYLICGVGSGAGTPVDVTNVKWGGSGGTPLLQEGSTLNIGANLKLSIWKLLAPTAQSSTIYADWGSSQDERVIFCVSANGVDQTTPIGTMATATGSASNTSTVNVTTSADDLVIDVTWAVDSFGGTLVVGAGQTMQKEIENPTLTYEAGGTSTEVATGASTTMSWTFTTGGTTMDDWGIMAIPLKPDAGGGGGATPRNLMMIGVGQ